MVAQEAHFVVVCRGDPAFPLQEIGEQRRILGRVGFQEAFQLYERPVKVHAVEQIGAVVIVGNQVKVLRQDEAGLAATEEAIADGFGNVYTGQDAVAAGTVVPVGPPVGQTAHGAVNPGAVHSEAPDVIVDQFGGVFLITGVVIVHGNTFPFVLQAAVPTFAGPFGVVPCNGELRSGAVGNIVKENGHAQTVGLVAVVFAAFFPAVALIDHGLVIGVIDAVFVVVKDRQQPHMVNAHGLQLGEIFGVLIEIILQRKACILPKNPCRFRRKRRGLTGSGSRGSIGATCSTAVGSILRERSRRRTPESTWLCWWTCLLRVWWWTRTETLSRD